ncbi:MAG: hypothetical protein LUC20_01585 [Oscillospiraceae bacterium]|nr:hypothetical protein [Oscillospiraceae bacterium]
MSDIRKGSFNTERPEIAVRLFGAVELRRGAVRVGERRERESLPWTLLKYLLVNRGREVSMEELDAVLWAAPDGSAISSGNARVRLSRLRKLLEPVTDDKRGGGLVLCYGGRFALNSDYRLTFDCDEFAALCRAERGLPPDDDTAVAVCGKALELYGGEFLAFTAPAPWLDVYREQYAELFRALAARTLERIKETGDETALDLLCSRSAELAPEDSELNDAIVAYLMERKMQIELVRHVSRLSAAQKSPAAERREAEATLK